MKCHPTAKCVALSPRKEHGRPSAMTPGAITQWFFHLYQKAGLEGVSSHSGRRTFATGAVKRAHNFHGSIVTVQRLLGHARLETTGAYIEPSADTIALVSSL